MSRPSGHTARGLLPCSVPFLPSVSLLFPPRIKIQKLSSAEEDPGDDRLGGNRMPPTVTDTAEKVAKGQQCIKKRVTCGGLHDMIYVTVMQHYSRWVERRAAHVSGSP